MIYADKGNKVVQISENEIQRYASQGFVIKDEKGAVLKNAVPNDISSFKQAYDKQLTEIESLQNENNKLKAEIDSLKKALSESKTTLTVKSVVDEVKSDSAENIEEQPKRNRRSNKAD